MKIAILRDSTQKMDQPTLQNLQNRLGLSVIDVEYVPPGTINSEADLHLALQRVNAEMLLLVSTVVGTHYIIPVCKNLGIDILCPDRQIGPKTSFYRLSIARV